MVFVKVIIISILLEGFGSSGLVKIEVTFGSRLFESLKMFRFKLVKDLGVERVVL